MHAVQELQEDGGEAAALTGQSLSAAVAEPVAERQPLLLYQQPEPVEGSIVRIGEQLDQRDHLHTDLTLHSVSRTQRRSADVGAEAVTCVVTSQPSSRLTMTEEPESRSSTTRTDTCRTLCSYTHTHTERRSEHTHQRVRWNKHTEVRSRLTRTIHSDSSRQRRKLVLGSRRGELGTQAFISFLKLFFT